MTHVQCVTRQIGSLRAFFHAHHFCMHIEVYLKNMHRENRQGNYKIKYDF